MEQALDKERWPEGVHRFIDWALGAEPPARIVYYQGSYARQGGATTQLMMRMAELGVVCLTQKRLGEGRYNYMATRVTPKTGKKLRPMEFTPE